MRVILFIGILATGCAAVHSAILYLLDEALQDALSGPWEYLGTGPWHGNARAPACAYRNARVLVVNVYCTAQGSAGVPSRRVLPDARLGADLR